MAGNAFKTNMVWWTQKTRKKNRNILFRNQINISLLNRDPIWLLDYSFYEWIIELTKQIIFPFMDLLVH